MDKLLKSPNSANVEGVDLTVVALVTIVEILQPRKEVIELRRTPISGAEGNSKTANIS